VFARRRTEQAPSRPGAPGRVADALEILSNSLGPGKVSGLRDSLAFLRLARFAPSADSQRLEFQFKAQARGIEYGGPEHLASHQVRAVGLRVCWSGGRAGSRGCKSDRAYFVVTRHACWRLRMLCGDHCTSPSEPACQQSTAVQRHLVARCCQGAWGAMIKCTPTCNPVTRLSMLRPHITREVKDGLKRTPVRRISDHWTCRSGC
jgi:hypothetical protein